MLTTEGNNSSTKSASIARSYLHEGGIADMELFFKLSGTKPSPLKYLKATCLEIFVPKRPFDFSRSKFIFR